MNFKIVLLLFQIYVHILFVLGFIYLDFIYVILVTVILHLLFSGLCGTVFFHRVAAHKNKINPIIEKILLALSTIGLSGSAIAWVATHRAHHRFSDTLKDPHSPKHIGYLRSYWYSSAGPESMRYVIDLLKDKRYLFQHNHYFKINLAYHAIVFAIAPFHIYWAMCIVPGFVMWFTGSMVNCFSHDNSGPRNNFLMGVVFAGEGWHKNHHSDAKNPSFQHSLDWGYYIFRAIK